MLDIPFFFFDTWYQAIINYLDISEKKVFLNIFRGLHLHIFCCLL